jgi:hypothetical protein
MRRVHPPPRAPHWHIDPPGRAVALALAPIVPGTGYELTFLDPGSINLQCLDSMNGFQFVKASDSEPESAPATRSPSLGAGDSLQHHPTLSRTLHSSVRLSLTRRVPHTMMFVGAGA